MDISLVLPLLISSVGIFLLFKLKFFFIIHPFRTLKEMLLPLREREKRRALCLALAGTLGVGNIFGVAAGIMYGGAGCLFWLFLSSLFSMAIKYSETCLAFSGGCPKGGMAGVISAVFKNRGAFLSSIYALFTVLLSLFMGSALQAEALLDVAESTICLMPAFGAFILLVLFLPCLLGGVKRIEKITEIIIPLTTIIYILMCFCVIFLNFSKIRFVISMIFSSAFSKEAILSGGALIALKEGFARGTLSNEAGVGSSALAHQRTEHSSIHEAGLFGICEVFFDTTLLCTLTGVTILISVDDLSMLHTPMQLVTEAFRGTLGDPSGYILLLLIFAFAYSTLICWYYYGSECISLYFPRFKWLFPFAFISFFLLTAVISSKIILYFTDVLILFMSVITLSTILLFSKKRKDGA